MFSKGVHHSAAPIGSVATRTRGRHLSHRALSSAATATLLTQQGSTLTKFHPLCRSAVSTSGKSSSNSIYHRCLYSTPSRMATCSSSFPAPTSVYSSRLSSASQNLSVGQKKAYSLSAPSSHSSSSTGHPTLGTAVTTAVTPGAGGPSIIASSAATTLTATSSASTVAFRTAGIVHKTMTGSLVRPAMRTLHQISSQRDVDDVVSFYDDKVAQFANQGIQTVTLKTLLGFGRHAPLSPSEGSSLLSSATPEDLEANLEVARYARKELPVRLARRVKSIQTLPFIVGTNPYIKNVYRLYYDAFQTVTAFEEEIRNKEDLARFATVLQGLVESHADVIPMLSQGFLECKKYMNKADIKTFLDDMIRARIGIRLIAEQVISLQEQYTVCHSEQEKDNLTRTDTETHGVAEGERKAGIVGVVHRDLKPAELVRTCASFVSELCNVNYGSSPEVIINGQLDAKFTYVPVHLEYILCEVLKNSLRATVEYSSKIGRTRSSPADFFQSEEDNLDVSLPAESALHSSTLSDQDPSLAGNSEKGEEEGATKPVGHPPVVVTIAQGEREITIRIRDQGGGVSKEDLDSIFDYSFTTVKNENETMSGLDANGGGSGGGNSAFGGGGESIFKGVSRLAMQAGLGGPIAGLGFGLPLTKIYAQYFGGSMNLVSLQGYGCDVFLKLKQIDATLEDIQI